MRTLYGVLVDVGLGTTAQADAVVAGDGTSIANYFLGEGLEPELTRDDVNDPLIHIDFYGREFSIYFYGCTDGTDCTSIQFFSGYRTDGAVRISQINQWNTEQRYAKAYLTETGAARIELDVFLGESGMNGDDFAGLLSRWVRQQADFETFIDW